ncbi:hypothetical protein DYB32_005581, partial [Aphanomyces invadans]
MGDFLLDAVAQFLKGAQWLDPVNAFMHTHKLAFVGVVGPQEAYSLQQHAIFVEFKDLADQLLEGIVQDLGCEPAAFVSALEEAVVNEAGGPKEEEVQLLMKTLLAYDDFHGFCTLMQSYVEWNAVPTMPPDDSEVQAGHEELSCRDDVPFDAKKYFGSPEWILQEVVARSLLDAQVSSTYLFLKEKVHFKHDLAQCETEIADFLFRRIQPSESAIVPHLLQWLLLESEAHEVQQDIQSRSFLSPRAEAKDDDPNDRWVQQWSDPDNAYYYTNAVTGEGRWDPPTSKDGEPILGYWNHDNEWVPYTFLTPGPADMTADGKEEASSTSDLKLPPLESKPWTPSAVLM